METDFNIRRAQSGDEEGLAKVHIQSWQEAYKNIVPQKYLDSLANEFQERILNWTKKIVNPKRWLWVATIDDQIVGFVLFGLPRDVNRDGYIELGAIYLLEKFKGLGIGFSLLRTGFCFMSTLGFKKSYCWVLKGNPTIKFYEKTGAKFSGLSKTDDIGGENFEELAYEWASISIENKTDLFSKQSDLYFQYRPQYPNELFHYLAQISSGTKIVWDCACGNGQASVSLSKYFDEVIATDISSEQIRNCKQISNVKYSVLRAEEKLPVEDHSLDLVTVAQAVHWFDLDVFYKEVARVLKPNGILAIWGYSFHHTSNSEMKRILDDFYFNILGPYWKPNNKLLWDGYRDLQFPFKEIKSEQFNLSVDWSLDELMMYFRTWSSTQLYIDSKNIDPTIDLKEKIKVHWGINDAKQTIVWPLSIKIGRVS